MTEKIHKRSILYVLNPDTESRTPHVVRDAEVNVALVAWQAVKDTELLPGDKLTVDIRILIERDEPTHELPETFVPCPV